MEEDFARKIGALLRDSESEISPNITSRLEKIRLEALQRGQAHRAAEKHIGRSVAIPWVAGIGTVVLAGIAAAFFLTTQPSFPLEEALHPENLPTRAYIDEEFKVWTSDDDSSED